ncbi:MAG: hypothetical protein WDN23_12975 [Edaphobacter sp.]
MLGLNLANQIESDQTQQIADAITNEEQELGSPPGSFNILEDLTLHSNPCSSARLACRSFKSSY